MKVLKRCCRACYCREENGIENVCVEKATPHVVLTDFEIEGTLLPQHLLLF